MTSINGMHTQPYFAPQTPNDADTQTEGAGRSKRGIANESKRWPDGELFVSIEGTDEASFNLIWQAIKEWNKQTPTLQIKLITGAPGDIRIAYNKGLGGNWSAIGTYAKRVPKDEPTMHLEPHGDRPTFFRTILHEFGHALGLAHEHQHPDRKIKFDEKAVFEGFFDKDEFGIGGIYESIISQFPHKGYLVTDYDEDSVMHYKFPANTNENGHDYGTQNELSPGDKDIIRKLYAPKKFPADVDTAR